MEINEATEAFRQDLINLVNRAGLPMVNIELVMKDVLAMVGEAKREAIMKERERAAQAAQEAQEVQEETEIVEEAT